MYWLDIWRFENSTEYEYKFAGNYGAKGEKRKKREKATPEQIKKQNQRNKENRIRRKAKCNFGENDIWATLKFPKGTKMVRREVMDLMRGFLGKMRYRYRKRGQPFKYIYRIEIGKRGSPHIHILLNRIPDVDILLKESWGHGRIDFTLAYEAGGFQKLAEYLAKPPLDEVDPDHETESYSCSRNLIEPEPERKVYFRRTVEKLIKNGVKPSEGFWIDEDTLYYGENPYTGMSYLKYIEYRIPTKGKRSAYNPFYEREYEGVPRLLSDWAEEQNLNGVKVERRMDNV